MKKAIHYFLTILAISIFGMTSYAQGLRYNSIQYQIQSANDTTYKVRFRVEQIWGAGSAYFASYSVGDTVPVTAFNFGDNDGGTFSLVWEETLPNGDYRGYAEGEHDYDINLLGYNAEIPIGFVRDGNLKNNASGLFRARLKVISSVIKDGYQSPTINVGVPVNIYADPLIAIEDSIDLTTKVLADDDAGNLTYSLPGPGETFLSGTLNGLPDFEEYSINPNNGYLRYKLAAGMPAGLYATQVKVTDELGGEGLVDFIIEVCTEPIVSDFIPNTPAEGFVFTTQPGNPVEFRVRAASTNGSTVSFNAVGIPAGATYTIDTVGTITSSTFKWTPDTADIGLRSLSFNIGCGGTSRNVLIKVLRDVPEVNLIALDSCSDDPAIRPYKISTDAGTPTAFDYAFINVNGDTLASGKGLSNPNGFAFLTDANPGGVAIQLSWLDGSGLNQASTIWNGGSCSCDASDDSVAVVDVSSGQACGSIPLTYYDGVSAPIELSATVTAGLNPPYTYLWSTGEISQNIFVTPAQNETYTVTITDAYGCTAEATAEVIYCDARAYKKNGDVDDKKVTICHYPPGNPGNVQTITISINALCTHIVQHGDQIGDCNCGTSNKTSNAIDYTEVTALNVFPNPSAGNFNIEYNLPEAGDVSIVMTDLTGRTVYQEAFDGAAGLYEHTLNLQGNAPGVYLLKVTLNADEYTVKLNIVE